MAMFTSLNCTKEKSPLEYISHTTLLPMERERGGRDGGGGEGGRERYMHLYIHVHVHVQCSCK